ncbi:hypothetical protein KQQSB11_260446 [Klebsiella quasipneumoniae subsp. quasipneumoniae]|nr:hypothetical protein KQQSB11_260446 [Klebsiella quasipneumoniae subsp. quasipneumoniae]
MTVGRFLIPVLAWEPDDTWFCRRMAAIIISMNGFLHARLPDVTADARIHCTTVYLLPSASAYPSSRLSRLSDSE